MENRSLTIYYCKQNAKTKKAEGGVLQQKLSSLLAQAYVWEPHARDYKLQIITTSKWN